ncbi:MAG: hypothetical protein HY843_05170 [Bdellovibrio sp.]|nr:hypothetical protein [Bdellovibrio sp.]
MHYILVSDEELFEQRNKSRKAEAMLMLRRFNYKSITKIGPIGLIGLVLINLFISGCGDTPNTNPQPVQQTQPAPTAKPTFPAWQFPNSPYPTVNPMSQSEMDVLSGVYEAQARFLPFFPLVWLVFLQFR